MNRQVTASDVTDLLMSSIVLPPADSSTSGAGSTSTANDSRTTVDAAVTGSTAPAETSLGNSGRRKLLQAISNLTGSTAGSTTQQNSLLNRTEALLQYEQLLADLWTNDSSSGIPLLLQVNFSKLLEGWHRLQCTEG
jgi:hypothetical protein